MCRWRQALSLCWSSSCGHLPTLQPVLPGQDPAHGRSRSTCPGTNWQHTHTTSHTPAVGSSQLSTAVPFGVVSKHRTGWLQPALVPASPSQGKIFSLLLSKLLPLMPSPSCMSIQCMAPGTEQVMRVWQCGTAWHISS